MKRENLERVEESAAPKKPGICQKCGKQACGQFDDKPGPNGITLAVPNGKYTCNWCGHEFGGD